MQLYEAFMLLELSQEADYAQVREAYRDLAQIWHPDRHAQNQRLLAKSNDKMRELNLAYSVLTRHFRQGGGRTTGAQARAGAQGTNPGGRRQNAGRAGAQAGQDGRTWRAERAVFLNCHHCRARNRLRPGANLTRVHCGRCGSLLYDAESTSEPCLDPRCRGRLGPDGRCRSCGRTPAEARAEIGRRSRRRARRRDRLATWRDIPWRARLAILAVLLCGLIPLAHATWDLGPWLGPLESRVLSTADQGVVELERVGLRVAGVQEDDALANVLPIDRDLFDLYAYTPREVAAMQRHLASQGFYEGKIDGIAGAKTAAGVDGFLTAFGVDLLPQDVEELPRMLADLAGTARRFPEWREFASSREFCLWLAQRGLTTTQALMEGIRRESPGYLASWVGRYFFGRLRPEVRPLPPTGPLAGSPPPTGKGPLARVSIATMTASPHLLVKLDGQDGAPLVYAFIRSGQRLDLGLPPGRYLVRYVAGSSWYGRRFLFGPHTLGARLDRPLVVGRGGRGLDLPPLPPPGDPQARVLPIYDF